MKNNVYSQIAPNIFEIIFNTTNIFHIMSSLFEILLLILILSWILKKISLLKINKRNAYIKTIDRISLGPNESIVIIKIEEIKLVLGITKNHITHLYTLSSNLKDDLVDKKKEIILPTKHFDDSLKIFAKIFWKKNNVLSNYSIRFLIFILSISLC
ncbi:flagellar biosynthetic protein FliO [Buchnera aphidicola (Rhopalosiphum padi)]|uniref:Flagellar protein n=1 Tax=Buchnera aphidicola subsp. Rhopalosiphum padi TaxID=98793 RepID=A0A4D6YG86_BUCRP|nr:flagellar biosynthetic protein FliO [Buchnera aphidicola]QCI24738.1 flagellar biosynthetic protein FliO [Buchnera aphidicola (Rhopalosiphum padi)]